MTSAGEIEKRFMRTRRLTEAVSVTCNLRLITATTSLCNECVINAGRVGSTILCTQRVGSGRV